MGNSNDGVEFDELGGDSDPEGNMETRKLQSLGRVDIPDDYLDHIDLEKGDKVMVVCEEDSVTITKATKDKLFGNGK